MSVLNHTHLHRETATLFTPDHCETCDGMVQTPNGVKVHPSDHNKLIILGITEVSELPPESWFDEDSGCEMCPNCPDPADEWDGQPDELTEWMDFDPDC